jgi:hypothetical protein
MRCAREGLVHFASADSALGWRGFMDGAIESGITAGLDAPGIDNDNRGVALWVMSNTGSHSAT